MNIDQLKAAWNAQADKHNQWDDLGIDEIVSFAQTQECLACAQVCEELWYDDPEGSAYARALHERAAKQ